MAQRLRAMPKPIVVLALVSLLSVGARVAWIGRPCRTPCRATSDHVLVFDEAYYVNAARVIAGIGPPAAVPPSAAHYLDAPLGDDPNSEHPQLAKLVMAGSIELFGDEPLAWRLGSVLMGTLAILGMFALVRAAGGSPQLATGAAALMALDNLLLVQGRIGTLDIYVVAAMVWAVAAYLRGRPLLAGVLIGVGACLKLVAPYALVVLVLLELIQWLRSRGAEPRAFARRAQLRVLARRALVRLGGCALAAAGVFVGLLAVLDRIAPPYDPVTAKLVGGGVFGHIGHMFSYATRQTSPHGPSGIASYPWAWLIDLKPITYLNIDPARPAPGLTHIHPQAHFLGVISPPILLAGLLSLVWLSWAAWPGVRRRSGRLGRLGRRVAPEVPSGTRVADLALAWTVGTFLPFVALSLIWQRTSYLYYMTVVMPGLYVAAACGAAALVRAQPWRARARRWSVWLFWLWAAAVLVAVVTMYPFMPLP